MAFGTEEDRQDRRAGHSPLHVVDGQIKPVRKLIIAGFHGTAAVHCPCGIEKAILIPLLPGLNATSECTHCGAQYTITRVDFDNSKPPGEQLHVFVRGMPPAIARPPRL